MAKRPSFQFYPDDWLGSNRILDMDLCHEGAYIRLICRAWSDPDCSIPDDRDRLAKWVGLTREQWDKGGYEMVADCFEPHPTIPGRLQHSRLVKERGKQDEWREKSVKGGRKSAELRREAQGKGGSKMVQTKRQPKGNTPTPSSTPSIKNPPTPRKTRKPPISKITLNRDNRTWIGITDQDMEGWRKAYPGINLEVQLAKMIEYRISNPQKRYVGDRGFITRWLGREDPVDVAPTPQPAPSPRDSYIPEDGAGNGLKDRFSRIDDETLKAMLEEIAKDPEEWTRFETFCANHQEMTESYRAVEKWKETQV